MLPWSMVKWPVSLFWEPAMRYSENCMTVIRSHSRNSEIVIKAASENNRIWKLLDLSIDQYITFQPYLAFITFIFPNTILQNNHYRNTHKIITDISLIQFKTFLLGFLSKDPFNNDLWKGMWKRSLHSVKGSVSIAH